MSDEMDLAVTFSKDDILKGTLIEPAWYRVFIEDVSKSLSKAGDSTNYLVKGKILFNADTKDKKYTDYPTPYWNFNSKAMGFSKGFFESLGVEIEPEKRYTFAAARGKQIDVYIDNKLLDDRMVNSINHKYRKPRD